MALLKQHVSEFSPDGKLLAVVNDQGILKIWDTETNELKQEFTPNLHLSSKCSALSWVPISSQKQSKNDRKSLERNTSLYIALASSTGGVSLYSYALGKIERDLNGEGHSGKITSMFYDGKETLYTSGEDCQVISWNLRHEKQKSSFSIGNERPHAIAHLPNSNNIIVGARQLMVYSLETQELVQTFTGHTSEVTILTSFSIEDTEYAVSASKMERIICLWKIGKKGKNKASTCTLLMEDIAHTLSCQLDDEGNLKLASVTRSGVIHVYLIPLDNIKSEKPMKPKVTIEIASDSASVIQPIPAIAASLEHAMKGQILFCYGDRQFLTFEQIVPNYSEKLQVLVRTDPKTNFSKKKSLQTHDYGSSLKTITPKIDRHVDYNTGGMVSRKKLKPVEMPFESRLQNLNLNVGEKPEAQSKVQLLIQALHSKDASMLAMVLQTKDTKVIEMTLQRLPVQYVGSLVNELTLMMQSKRIQVESSARWLKILTQTHSSQLMALGTDDLLNKFGPCIGMIEYRSNCLMELSKLNGRLQLLVSQIKRNKEEDNLNNDNALLYADSDTSNSDMEEGMVGKSESDGEWEEDDDEEMES
ncbi:WD repeat-containing protein 43 [Episyrphus balteatus]|uniref:WD repeat-containing protein 43 n=1 Tax=Episyrphus balteatus TaxID=286459 RepID=UPI0024863D41|nr:WD repeat-containing protein 43 [Episyrphus balteatus]